MNMITVLLGATGLLLVIALALSFGQMNKGASQEEIAALQREIAALNIAEEELQLRRDQGLYGSASTAPLTPQAPLAPSVPVLDPALQGNPDPDDAALIAELEAELLEKEKETEDLKIATEAAEKKATTYKNEAGIAWQSKIESHDKNRARGKTIMAAFLQARITNWSAESGFGVIDVIRPESVQVGTILAIRRQTGIYGQVKVSQMYEGGQAVIDPIPSTFLGDDGVDLQAGDELIIPPL